MALTRKFFPWTQPFLASVVDFYFESFLKDSCLDLENFVFILPSSRASRRITELLVEQAEQQQVLLVPPQIVTTGAIAELFTEPGRNRASLIESRSCWIRALQSFEPHELAELSAELPARNDYNAWYELAERFSQIASELAAHGLRIPDVVPRAQTTGGFVEEQRWELLSQVYARYLKQLESISRIDRNESLLATSSRPQLNLKQRIYLLGVSDLAPQFKNILINIEKSAVEIHSLIFAPEKYAECFDDLGCIISEAWKTMPLEIPDSIVSFVRGPRDQAKEVSLQLANLGSKFQAQEISIGVPDSSLVPYLRGVLSEVGIDGHDAQGMAAAQSGPVRLLLAISRYCATGLYQDFAHLLRHPDLLEFLKREISTAEKKISGEDILSAFDRYYRQKLPAQLLTAELAGQSSLLKSSQDRIEKLLHVFRTSQQPLAGWGAAIAELLIAIYGKRVLNIHNSSDKNLLALAEVLSQVLSEFVEASAAISPELSGAEVLTLFVRLLGKHTIPQELLLNSVEFLGWLELVLDDAPVLIVCGVNEGFVPESLNSDPFLPNGLRQKLGLLDNDKRFARDIYALSAMVPSRKFCHLIAGRLSVQGEALLPSRLLLIDQSQKNAQRILKFFNQQSEQPSLAVDSACDQQSKFFEIPRPQPLLTPLLSARVTSFKDYLRCKYRFYLKHVLGLEARDDRQQELDPFGFGNLGHAVLQEFALSTCRDSHDEREIAHFLSITLDQKSLEILSRLTQPAVLFQKEQLRKRLEHFAAWQARWRAQGWVIQQVELDLSEQSEPILIDQQPFVLKGRVDRIDHHPGLNRYAIFDYKIGDQELDPEQVHRDKKGDWKDLQLPLYLCLLKRQLLRSCSYQDLQLGYLRLSANPEVETAAFVHWSEQDFSDAWARMEEIVRALRKEDFWPPSRVSGIDEFAQICRVGVDMAEVEIAESEESVVAV